MVNSFCLPPVIRARKSFTMQVNQATTIIMSASLAVSELKVGVASLQGKEAGDGGRDNGAFVGGRGHVADLNLHDCPLPRRASFGV